MRRLLLAIALAIALTGGCHPQHRAPERNCRENVTYCDPGNEGWGE